MKTVTLEEAQNDLERLLREAAAGEPIVVTRGNVRLGSLSAPPEREEPAWEGHLERLAAEGAILRADPNAPRRIHRRGEGEGTAASDWIIEAERADRA